jgi:branched-chain amino acid transport system permease protein
MDLDLLLQLAKNGLVMGLLYGLLAYGLSLIISTTGVFHFAHGLSVTAGAYSFWWLFSEHSVTPWLAVPISLAVAGAMGVLLQAGVYRSLRKAGAGEIAVLVASFALLTLGESLFMLVIGSDPKAIPPTDFLQWRAALGPVTITTWDLLVVVSSVVVFVALNILQTRTAVGLSFRAVGDNPERATTLGIRLQRTHAWVFFVGSAVAGIPGVLLSVQNPVGPHMGFELIVLAVIALVVGGIGSMPGALIGGIAIGLVESIAVYALPTEWARFTLYALLFVWVVIRPRGFSRVAVRHA